MGDKQFKNVEYKVGLFVLSSIILLIVIIGTFFVQKQVFVQKIKIEILADSGEGLSKSMPIMYSGFQIAKVYDVQLRDDGLVTVITKIPKRYKKWIKPDSKVNLGSQGLIGPKVIVFSGGKFGDLQNGQTYTLQREKGLAALIEKGEAVLEDVKNIIANIEELSNTVVENKKSIEQLMVGMGDVGNDLHNKEGSLAYMIRTNDLKNELAQITKKVRLIQDNVIKITDTVDKMSKENQADIKDTVTNVKEAVKSINNAVQSVDKAVNKVVNETKIVNNVDNITKNLAEGTDNLTTIKKETDEILNTTNRLLINLEGRWPFSSGDKKVKSKVKLP